MTDYLTDSKLYYLTRVFQYHCTRPDCSDFLERVQAKMNQLTIEELQRLPEELRPRSYLQTIENPRRLDLYKVELFIYQRHKHTEMLQ